MRVPRLQRIKQADEGDGNVSAPLFEVADEQMPLPSLGTRGHPKKCIWSAKKLACCALLLHSSILVVRLNSLRSTYVHLRQAGV